jgi:peptidyl-prolyl cis-trans isomerase A (cyclophilin A)
MRYVRIGSVMMTALAVAAAAAAQGRGDFKNPASLTEQAPPTFKAKFETSAGDFVIEVHRDWAPKGADRFYNLVKSGYFTDVRFFRVISGFMAQFGLNGDPAVNRAWQGQNLTDDPPKESNRKGTITYANAGPNTRSTQFFINLVDNSRSLDAPQMAFTPFGRVVSGMDAVEKIYSGYGEGAPRGSGPDQGKVRNEGNAYLTKEFPKLDYIKKATIVP